MNECITDDEFGGGVSDDDDDDVDNGDGDGNGLHKKK